MDFRISLARRTAAVARLGILVTVSAATIGSTQAQIAATTPSRASLSGIQSVIIHARDSVQRRVQAAWLRSQQHQQLRAKPDLR